MHNNFTLYTQYQKNAKTYRLNNLIKMGIPESLCIFDNLAKHTETFGDYIIKYRDVVRFIDEGKSLRKVSEITGISYGTVGKVSTILKYGNSSLKPNPYLQKYSEVVKELLNGLTQREIAHKTGVSLATVSTVAKITEMDYIELNKEKGVVKKRKWREKTKNDKSILAFIKKNYLEWINTLQEEMNDEVVLRKYNEYLETITIPSIFDRDRYNKIGEKFADDLLYKLEQDRRREKEKEKGRERVRKRQKEIKEYKRLKKIKDDKAKKISDARWEEESIRLEQKKLRESKIRIEEKKKFEKNIFYKLIDAGINPFSKEWDKLPEEYINLEHRFDPISYPWSNDQRLIFQLRKSMSNLEEYAKNNVKEFNLDLAEDLLQHYAFIRRKQFYESYDYLESARQNGIKLNENIMPSSE